MRKMTGASPKDFTQSLICHRGGLDNCLRTASQSRFKAAAMQFLFADYVLDTDLRELHRGAEPIAVEPQVFDLLAYLVQNRNHVVSKDDLIASVWGGRIVSDSALTTRINAARKA